MFTYLHPISIWGWKARRLGLEWSGAVFSAETVQEVAGDETGWVLE